MDAFAHLMLVALICAPSLFAISSAMRSNRDGKPRPRSINAMLVGSLLLGVISGAALLVVAAVFLQVETFVTLAFGLLCIILSLVPFFIAYWALRALRGAERWPGAA